MKMTLLSILLATVSLQASALAKQVTVHCRTPGMLAGGSTITLTGALNIVVSPTTGMTKLAEGSELMVTMTSARARKPVSGKILVSGTYLETASVKRISANEEPSSETEDNRTFSEIIINGAHSSIFELRGNQKHPLECAPL